MSAPIAPGDWVECVNVGGYPNVVRVGGVYLVEDVGEVLGYPTLILLGVAHPTKGYRHVAAEYFRPIYRPSAKLIEQLKQPVDIDSDEPVSVTA